jgi:hypothetical protein
MGIYLVGAPISIQFDKNDLNQESFLREYHQLSQADDDPISGWLKLAKARGETSDSDPVLLKLMVELYRKIDGLEKLIKDEQPVRVDLNVQSDILNIGFEHFELAQDILEVGAEYYGRVDMPVHPKRDVGIFFQAQTPSLAKITKIHERDQKDWNIYLRARERVKIRELKEDKS